MRCKVKPCGDSEQSGGGETSDGGVSGRATDGQRDRSTQNRPSECGALSAFQQQHNEESHNDEMNSEMMTGLRAPSLALAY